MIEAPINETLPATGAGAALISLPSGKSASDFAIQARGSVDMKISNLQALTTYYTLKSGTAISLGQIVSSGAELFYAESGGAADTVELIYIAK